MASIVLSSVGSDVGNYLWQGVGGKILGTLGNSEGKGIDAALGIGSLFDKGSSAKNGPRIENLKVQDSRYGAGIPTAFGRARVAGNIIWASSLIETSHEAQLSGGKGGVLGGGSSRTTYTYSIHCAAAIAEGEIGGIATIWGDSKVIYQNGVWASGVVGSATFYNGTTTQNADPFMQSCIGAAQTPAYRGIAYVVMESLQLANFGNRLPNLTFEVLPVGGNAPSPQWLGVVDSAIQHLSACVRNKAMPPIIIEGSSVRAGRVLVGGFKNPDATATFDVVEYDVSGDSPVEVARTESSSVTVNAVADHAWALSPDGLFVACYIQTVSATPTHQIIIYDVENQRFGNPLALNLSYAAANKQIAWADAQHFVFTDVSGGNRGLRVLARAGLNVVDLGFYDVWGAGSASSTVPLFYAQFLPLSGGLFHIVADQAPGFTALYARYIVWQNNALIVGARITLTSGYSTGTGSGPQAALLQTAADEWTIFYGTAVDMRLMSFQPFSGSVTVTRPWQTLTNSSFSVTTSNHPAVFGDRIVVAQRGSTDNSYRLSEISLDAAGSFSLAVDGAVVGGFSSPMDDFGAESIGGSRLLLSAIGGFYDDLSQVAIIQRCNTGDTLDNIVAAILNRAGYASGDYDVSALAGIPVDGYVLPDMMEAAAALVSLQSFAPFDLIESDGVLKAVPRGNTPVVAIPASETRATDKPGAEPLPQREQTRLQELDLPVEVTVDYLDASRDYEVGSQRARRTATRGAKTMAKLRLPIVCTAELAKQIAERQLYTAWAERDHAKLRWSRRWLAVDPADVVDLGDRLMRVAQTNKTGGVLQVSGALIASAPIVSIAQADVGTAINHTGVASINSALYLMDLPLLRVDDDQPGVYAAIGGLSGWPGAAIWRAADGVNYSNIAGFSAAATSGIATSALADASPHYMDCADSVNVQLMQGTLASCGAADLLNGANVALLGGEIIQFQTATLVGSGLYTLSNLLRGRRGTEAATSTHAVGEAFVLLTAGTVQFVTALLTDRGRMYEFRALSNGQSLGDMPDMDFTYSLATLQPRAPTHIVGSRAGGTGSDLTLSWVRRARMNADWVDYVDVPLDEPAELYDVEIMNGSTVVRTFFSVTTPSQIYTAAEQTADWGGGIPAHYTVNVYQISSRYGRGQAGTAAV